MAETLSGSISEMSLLEIFKLLNSNEMNGRLIVTNSIDRGEVYVKSGQIIHCVVGANTGETALTNLLGWIEGNFRFENGVEAPETSIDKSTDQILLDGTRMMQKWKEIKKIISSMEIIFALSQTNNIDNINLQPEEWQILAHVNGNRTIKDIIKESGRDEFEVVKILYQFHSTGLIVKTTKPSKPASATVDEQFFKKIEKEFANVIGPMAPFIIEEAIAYLDESQNSFPKDKIAALIEKVSVDIKDENKKLQFSQIMLNLLKDI
jgi:hypothetical protein